MTQHIWQPALVHSFVTTRPCVLCSPLSALPCPQSSSMLPKARLHRKSPVSNHCWFGSPVDTRSMLLSSAPGAIADTAELALSGLGFRPDLLFSNSAVLALLSSAPGALAVAVSGLSVVKPGSVAPVAAGSLSLTLLSWPGLAWLLPASAGLEALRSLRLALRHLSEVDIDVFLEIFTTILFRIEDLVSLALYNYNIYLLRFYFDTKRFLQVWRLWLMCSLQLRHQGVLVSVDERRRLSLTRRLQKYHALLKYCHEKRDLERSK